MPYSPRLIGVLLAGALVLSACGGDAPEVPRREAACKDSVTIRATFLPPGFSPALQKGPVPGKDEVEGAVTYHWRGQTEDAYIELFRKGQRNRFKKGKKIEMLGQFGRYAQVEGGYAAKVKLARGECTRYQLEGFGIPETEFKKVIAGLRRGATTPTAEG